MSQVGGVCNYRPGPPSNLAVVYSTRGLPTIPCTVFTPQDKFFLSFAVQHLYHAIVLRQRMLSIVAVSKFVRSWEVSPGLLSFLGKKSLCLALFTWWFVCVDKVRSDVMWIATNWMLSTCSTASLWMRRERIHFSESQKIYFNLLGLAGVQH